MPPADDIDDHRKVVVTGAPASITLELSSVQIDYWLAL